MPLSRTQKKTAQAIVQDDGLKSVGWPAEIGEKRWIGSYVETRESWLANHSNQLRGSSIEEVQRLLGFTGDDVDGLFGPATDLAVRNFQHDQGLVVDGKVGPPTWAALEAAA